VAVTIDPTTTQVAPSTVTNPKGSATTPAKEIDCTKKTVTSGVIAITALTLDASI
jgi:hypothetical protein